jgi:O-antigen ligase
MLKKFLPNTRLIGLLILTFAIRVYLFSRGKTDPTALDIYNIVQIGIGILLGLVIILRKDFFFVAKTLMRSPLGWLIALYIFGILSGLWSAIPLFSTYFAAEGLIYTFALAIILYQQPDNNSMERFAITISFLFIFFMLAQIIKLTGFSFNLFHWHTNNYSAIGAMLFGYCYGEYNNRYRNKSEDERRLLKRGIWISLFFVVLGTSSASNISLLASLVVITLISGKRSFKFISLFLFGLAILTYRLYGDILNEILFPGKTVAGIEMFGGRTHIWEYYSEPIKQKPIAGWGFASLARISKLYTTHTHNSLIEIAGGVGLIGLIFYVIYLTRMLYKLIRNVRAPYSVGVIGAITAGFVNGNAVSFMGSAAGAIFFAFIIWNVLGWYTLVDANNYYYSENDDVYYNP